MSPKKENSDYFVQKRKVVFSKGPIHLVDCDVRMESSKVLSRQVIEHPGAVVIIPQIKKKPILADSTISLRNRIVDLGVSCWRN